MNTNSQKEGFVVLFAVLIAAIIMLIGAGIFSIAFKETVLSSTAREASRSLAAADAGAECALYHDVKQNKFSTPSTVSNIDCNDVTLTLTNTSSSVAFTMPVLNTSKSEGPCAEVTISKISTTSDGVSAEMTRIRSRGFNLCDYPSGQVSAKVLYNDPLLVERVFQVTYMRGTAASLGQNSGTNDSDSTVTGVGDIDDVNSIDGGSIDDVNSIDDNNDDVQFQF